MKNIRFVLALAFAMVMSFCASAQGLPVGSEDSLRNYALGKVVSGHRWVQSPSMATVPGQPLYTSSQGGGAEDVMTQLLGKEIVYTIQNPSDKVTGYVNLYDESGNALFGGRADYLIDEFGGKGAGPSYSLWMYDIPMGEGVNSAKILVFDEKGETRKTIYLEINRKGQLLFPSYMAGAPNGLLVVNTTDGNILTYKLSDPKPVHPSFTIDSGSSFQIPGHHVYRQSRDETVYLDFVEVHYLPTVYLEFLKEQQVIVDVQGLLQKDGGTFIERPSGLYYERGDGLSGYIALNLNSTTTIRLPEDGKYRIRFVWSEFGKPNTIYIPTSEDDGGKG